MLVLSLAKAGLDPKVTSFFEDFLVKRKTNYTWNEFSSPMFEVNVGVGQESALSPILSALYLSPLLYILEKCLKTINIPVSLYLLLMTVSSSPRTNLLTFQTHNFSVVTTFYLASWTNLDLT